MKTGCRKKKGYIRARRARRDSTHTDRKRTMETVEKVDAMDDEEEECGIPVKKRKTGESAEERAIARTTMKLNSLLPQAGGVVALRRIVGGHNTLGVDGDIGDLVQQAERDARKGDVWEQMADWLAMQPPPCEGSERKPMGRVRVRGKSYRLLDCLAKARDCHMSRMMRRVGD
jgi:hypothetical protein